MAENRDVESWVQSIDREVSALARANAQTNARLDAQHNQLSHIESVLDSLNERANQPKPPFQLLGAIAAIATLVVAFGVFINLRLVPNEAALARVVADVEHHEHTSRIEHSDQNRRIGETEVLLNELDRSHRHLDEMHHKTEDQVATLEQEAAAHTAKIETLQRLMVYLADGKDDRQAR